MASSSVSAAAAGAVVSAASRSCSPAHVEQVLARFAAVIPLVGKKSGVAPAWELPARRFFELWPKLRACSPKYREFVKSCDPKDLKNAHVFMNDAASRELVEYYLCCALLLRPNEVETIATNGDELLKLAEKVAREDVEPVTQAAQALALEYDEAVHRKLEDQTVWMEIDKELFWHHSFRSLASAPYDLFRGSTAAAREAALEGVSSISTTASTNATVQSSAATPNPMPPDEENVANADQQPIDFACLPSPEEIAEELSEEARGHAVDTYATWLGGAGMPIRGDIRNCLLDHALLHGVPRAWEGVKQQFKHADDFAKKRSKVTEHSFSLDQGPGDATQ